MDIVIAGGGVAGLEALLALRAMARNHARLTLIAPDPDFSYRPLAVAEPFGLGHAHRVPLERFAADADAELVIDAVVGVDDDAREVHLRDGGSRPFEALIAAPGGRAVAGVKGATTWWPGGDAEPYSGLLRDIDEGYAKRIAIVIPPGAVWPLPAYELALMTAGEAEAMGQTDVKITVVTPEREPLTLFGEHASRALAEELALGRRRCRDRCRGARRRRRSDARARRRSPRRPARLRDPADRRAGARRPGVRRGGLHPHPGGRPRARRASTRGPRATASPRRSSSAAWRRIRRGSPQPVSPSSRA